MQRRLFANVFLALPLMASALPMLFFFLMCQHYNGNMHENPFVSLCTASIKEGRRQCAHRIGMQPCTVATQPMWLFRGTRPWNAHVVCSDSHVSGCIYALCAVKLMLMHYCHLNLIDRPSSFFFFHALNLLSNVNKTCMAVEVYACLVDVCPIKIEV